MLVRPALMYLRLATEYLFTPSHRLYNNSFDGTLPKIQFKEALDVLFNCRT